MTFNTRSNRFNLTASKMNSWHRHAHMFGEKGNCLICKGDMRKIATWLKRKGFEVHKSASNFITIAAEENVRLGDFGPTSDEVDRLYVLIAGFEELSCSECGKPMVIRRRNGGPHYECSGAPDCQNILPVR